MYDDVACPSCDSMNLHVSRPQDWIERWLLPFFRVYVLTCNDCEARFRSKHPPQY